MDQQNYQQTFIQAGFNGHELLKKQCHGGFDNDLRANSNVQFLANKSQVTFQVHHHLTLFLSLSLSLNTNL